ncbi:MAG TPA: hypothetical protein PKL15_09355 [Saprospiraceae bacterium]|nr:hypothetical protein [Saprospiraceae bacterium]HNM25625.1 hypothetical protein [Saprospiraceae bacterium]
MPASLKKPLLHKHLFLTRLKQIWYGRGPTKQRFSGLEILKLIFDSGRAFRNERPAGGYF